MSQLMSHAAQEKADERERQAVAEEFDSERTSHTAAGPLDALVRGMLTFTSYDDLIRRIHNLYTRLDLDESGAVSLDEFNTALAKLKLRKPIRLSLDDFNLITNQGRLLNQDSELTPAAFQAMMLNQVRSFSHRKVVIAMNHSSNDAATSEILFALKVILSLVDQMGLSIEQQTEALSKDRRHLRSKKELLNRIFRSGLTNAFSRWVLAVDIIAAERDGLPPDDVLRGCDRGGEAGTVSGVDVRAGVEYWLRDAATNQADLHRLQSDDARGLAQLQESVRQGHKRLETESDRLRQEVSSMAQTVASHSSQMHSIESKLDSILALLQTGSDSSHGDGAEHPLLKQRQDNLRNARSKITDTVKTIEKMQSEEDRGNGEATARFSVAATLEGDWEKYSRYMDQDGYNSLQFRSVPLEKATVWTPENGWT